MARQAAAYLIMGSLAASLVQCSSHRSKEPHTATAPAPQPTSTEPSMAPAAGTMPSSTATAAQPAPTATESQPAEPAAERQAMSDEQIAAITDAANTAEIEQAKLAQKNAKNARVKKFAAMMITDHTQAKEKQKKLLGKLNVTPQSGTMAAELETQSQQKLSELKGMKGAEFDTAYIEAQVEAHQKVLDSFDNQLIPNAKNAEFKALLGEIRPKVAAHLSEAKEIQQELTSGATSQPSKSGGSSGTKTNQKPEGSSGTKKTNPEHSGHNY